MRWFAILALVCVTAVWGYTFVVVQNAIRLYPVVPFLSLRFAFGALLLCPLLLRGARDITSGIMPGLALAAGYLFQTVGLEYTTASQAGLLTGLFVVLTPLLEFAAYRSRPRSVTVVAVLVAFAGVALLALTGSTHMSRRIVLGDSLELATALAFSVHLILLGRASTGRNSGQVAVGQIATAAVLFTAGASTMRGYSPVAPTVGVALLITAAGATAAAFWVQTFVQQRLSPSRTALVLVLEPAFATFFGFLLAGNTFTHLQAIGASCIFVALAGHEMTLSLKPGTRPVAG